MLGVTPIKIEWGVRPSFKPLPYLSPKSAILPTLFMTKPKIQNPIYDRCDLHSCLKQGLLLIVFSRQEPVTMMMKKKQLDRGNVYPKGGIQDVFIGFPSRSTPYSVQCYTCAEWGHLARKCKPGRSCDPLRECQ